MKKQKAAIFLVDGANWEIINKGIKEGRLPTLKHMMDKGFSSTIKSVFPPASCPAISSTFTGKNPGKHGLTSSIKKDGTIVTSKDVNEPFIWELLSENGIRSLVYDVIATFPPKKFDGMIITSRPPSKEDIIFTYPEELAKKFDIPYDLAYRKDFSKMSDKEIYLAQNEITQKKIDIFFELLRKQNNLDNNLDFSIYVLKGTDTMQHFLWHRKDLIMNYYEKIDKRIKELIDMEIAENLFVISDHGFEEFGTIKFYVNAYLKSKGFLVPTHNYLFSNILLKLVRLVEMTVPRNTLRKAFFKLRNIQARSVTKAEDTIAAPPYIDGEQSEAFADSFWGIRIGKKYQNTESYEKIRTRVIESLKELKYEGTPVVREIHRKEEEFSGKYTGELPDIVFLCNPKFHPTFMYSEKLFRPFRDKKTGNHFSARDGILIACGKDIRRNSNEAGIKQVDMVPTILHIYDTKIPSDMDGSIIKNIFNEQSVFFKKPVTYEQKSHKEHKERLKNAIAKIKI